MMRVELDFLIANRLSSLKNESISEVDLMKILQEDIRSVLRDECMIDTRIGMPGARIPEAVSTLRKWYHSGILNVQYERNKPMYNNGCDETVHFSVQSPNALKMIIDGYIRRNTDLLNLSILKTRPNNPPC